MIVVLPVTALSLLLGLLIVAHLHIERAVLCEVGMLRISYDRYGRCGYVHRNKFMMQYVKGVMVQCMRVNVWYRCKWEKFGSMCHAREVRKKRAMRKREREKERERKRKEQESALSLVLTPPQFQAGVRHIL